MITIYNFYLSNPSFSNLVLSLFVSTMISDVLSGLADLRATLGAPPPTGPSQGGNLRLSPRICSHQSDRCPWPIRPVCAGARRVQHFDVPRDLALICVDQKRVNNTVWVFVQHPSYLHFELFSFIVRVTLLYSTTVGSPYFRKMCKQMKWSLH
jgi:hypothetical protein